MTRFLMLSKKPMTTTTMTVMHHRLVGQQQLVASISSRATRTSSSMKTIMINKKKMMSMMMTHKKMCPMMKTLSSSSSSRSWFSTTTTAGTTASSTSATTTTTTLPRRRRSSSSSHQVPLHAMLSMDNKVKAPPMVYISGEEMTRYACDLIVKQWFEPYFDLEKWEYYDLSCNHRDDTNDQVLRDAIMAGKRLGSIFKEPTITPSAIQQKQFNLSGPLPSPNGAMRRGWNGVTISRDTIHIEGIELGYKKQVLFERHAVGGEYSAGYSKVGQGTLLTTYLPSSNGDGGEEKPPFVVDKRDLTDDHNVVVVYHNPYDNVEELAHLFFKRCLEHEVTPYIVTKKTVFKWQEGFWLTMKSIFDEQYKEQFINAGLLESCNNELQHLISDAATMQLIRWTNGGFGMASHNYDGDMLTDQIAQIHRSPGFITSNLVGKNDIDGTLIKEFEASHGTVSDLWNDHISGKETSLNPLGLVEAMIGAMQHSATIQIEKKMNQDTDSDSDHEDEDEDEQKDVTTTTTTDSDDRIIYDQIMNFTTTLRTAIHNTFRYGQGTRDMSGPSGYTTEDFIHKVAWRLQRYLIAQQYEETPAPKLSEPDRKYRRNYAVDEEAVNAMFNKYDKNGDGYIDFEEFTTMLTKLNLAPRKKKGSGADVITDDEEKVPDV